ncbi:MAG: lycopene cyclase domain-containing protein [Candidatus Omnitrophota bacterium]|nr:MAG: lycopene cyclase domain-containing protein [Candidatus Omnitrophota bacterium]
MFCSYPILLYFYVGIIKIDFKDGGPLKEYTIIALVSVVITIFTEYKLKTGIFKNRLFYRFLLIILLFKLMVNGYLTSSQIVNYNPDYFLGLRLISIPFEDFLFGFSMVTLTICFWEHFGERNN